jgi:hypothetical protein
MADRRRIIIEFDEQTFTWDYHTEGNLNIDPGFSSYTRTAKYENTLVNGEVDAVDPLGVVTHYTDGCHLVREESGRLTTMSKPEYVEWNGRPGSENED